MTQDAEFPFELDDAFFTTLRFNRLPELPPTLNLEFSVEVKIHEEQFPDRLQIDVRLVTPGEQPLTLLLELVAVFTPVEGRSVPSPERLSDLVNKRALHMLWPYMVQMVRQMTAQMGMPPVNLGTPYAFHAEPE